MKLIRNFLTLAACAVMALATPALAADVTVDGPGLTFPVNQYLVQARRADLGTNYSNATTTATIVASASGTTAVSVPATTFDYTKQHIRVCYGVQATKATSTTGSVSVFVNGAVLASSTRTIGVVSAPISSCTTIVRSSAAAQTVSLYGVSGDTAAFTISAAYIEVWIITIPTT